MRLADGSQNPAADKPQRTEKSVSYTHLNRVIEVSGEAYPELVEKKDYIQKIIAVEEQKFASTIDQGTSIIGEYVEELKKEGKTQLEGRCV